jgi:hypothetical protein
MTATSKGNGDDWGGDRGDEEEVCGVTVSPFEDGEAVTDLFGAHKRKVMVEEQTEPGPNWPMLVPEAEAPDPVTSRTLGVFNFYSIPESISS